MTVKELAKYLKLSEQLIYKLAQNSEVPAAKVGGAWRFSQEEIDKWMLAQSKPDKSWPPEEIKKIVDEFHQEIKQLYGNNLSCLLLFGSWARGDATEESHIDLLVVLKNINDYWKEWHKVKDIAYNTGFNFEKERCIVISTILMNEEEYLHGDFPLILNIRRDGIKAA